ncbi:MAG: helix-turn-helix domain-containing protein [Rhodoglobus sp.]
MTNEELTALLDERRPKRADARRNFDALVEAARDAFAADGVDASLEDIARRAGVGIGTLYRNFPTRDALVEAVYLEEVAGVAAYAEGLDDRQPFEAMAAWLRRFADYAATKKVLLTGFNSDSTLLQSCRGVVFASGEPLLKRAQAAGEVRPDVAIDDAVRLVSGVAGVEFPEPGQRDRVIDVALDGLRAR